MALARVEKQRGVTHRARDDVGDTGTEPAFEMPRTAGVR
jgi:hypothetical protein